MAAIAVVSLAATAAAAVAILAAGGGQVGQTQGTGPLGIAGGPLHTQLAGDVIGDLGDGGLHLDLGTAHVQLAYHPLQ